MTSPYLLMQISEFNSSIDELVIDKLNKRETEEYYKLQRLVDLFYEAALAGWDAFDWEEAHELGWFCKKDYRIFPELKWLDYKDAGKRWKENNNE